MILQHYVDPGWLENSFKSWEQRCQKAQSAEAVDVLKEVAALVSLHTHTLSDVFAIQN